MYCASLTRASLTERSTYGAIEIAFAGGAAGLFPGLALPEDANFGGTIERELARARVGTGVAHAPLAHFIRKARLSALLAAAVPLSGIRRVVGLAE